MIYGLLDSPFEGGYYHGKLMFPVEYPMKPPGVTMITPSGRFKPKERICLSISDFHPETWSPAWNVETILTGLVSFFDSEENTTGCMISSSYEKRRYAMQSVAWNMNDPEFIKYFKPMYEKIGINKKKIEQSREN